MKASELNPNAYPSFPEFKTYGIPLEHIDAHYLVIAQTIRNKYGIPMTPSPVTGGFVRFDGNVLSRHYAVNRLSDAGDWFPKKGCCLELFEYLLTESAIGGLGLYADTHFNSKDDPYPLIHFDLRPLKDGKKVLWVRDEGKYYYLNTNPRAYQLVKLKVMAIEHGLSFQEGKDLGSTWAGAWAKAINI